MKTLEEFMQELAQMENFLYMDGLYDELEPLILLGKKGKDLIEGSIELVSHTENKNAIKGISPTFHACKVVESSNEDVFEVVFRKRDYEGD